MIELGFTFSYKLDWGSYIFPIVKTASEKIEYLICSMKFIVCTPHSFPLERGRLNLLENFQKGGGKGDLTGPLFLKGGCWERGANFFQAGCNFLTKNELKSELFNEKKSLYTRMLCSVVTKNSNWEIFAKNLVTFER